MTDMKKLLTIVTESGEKARIDEGVNVSINVSGDSPCDVGEVLAKVTNLSGPRPVTPDMMPAVSSPPPMPMVKAIDIVGKGDGPAVPPAPPGDMAPHIAPEAIGQSIMMPDPSEGPSNGPSTSSQVAPPMGGVAMGGAAMGGEDEGLGLDENDPEEPEDDWRKDVDTYSDADNARDEYYDLKGWKEEESMLDPAMGSAHGEEEMEEAPPVDNERAKIQSAKDKIESMRDLINKTRGNKDTDEEFENEPDPKYSDINYMTKKLAGGLNKPKTMYPNSYKQGDNPLAMETIVREEWQKFKAGE